MQNKNTLSKSDINRIIEMAWEDRTPFDVIYKEFDITQNELERLMRNNLKPSSFKLWRKRVSGRKTKHMELKDSTRFKSTHKRKL